MSKLNICICKQIPLILVLKKSVIGSQKQLQVQVYYIIYLVSKDNTTVTASGGLTGTEGILVTVSEYSTSTYSTERSISFWEDSKNIAWFTLLMLIILVVICLLILWILTGANCSKLLTACKRRR